MTPFNRKRKELLKTLTEKEIQKKLYGQFSTDTDVVGTYSNGSKVKAAPPQIVPPARTESVGHDLFGARSSEATVSVKPAPDEPKAPYTPPQEIRNAARPAKPATRPAAEPARGTSVAKMLRENLLPAAVHFAKLIFTKLLEGLALVVFGLIRLVASLDLRKPYVRRFFYAVALIGFVGSLFAGIHYLNIRRERAMKEAKKRPVVTVRQERLPAAPVAEAPSPAVPSPAVSAAAPAAEAVRTPAPAPVEAPKPYVIQIATFAQRADAQKLVGELKAADESGFLKPLTRPSGKTYFCVYIGRFATSEEGEAKLQSFRKKDVAKPFHDAFVRSLPEA